jgi:hypothetical protein
LLRLERIVLSRLLWRACLCLQYHENAVLSYSLYNVNPAKSAQMHQTHKRSVEQEGGIAVESWRWDMSRW